MIKTFIFDLGNVLIKWDPTLLFEDMFSDEDDMEYFLKNICTMEWNEQQDAGRSWEIATNLLLEEYPEYEDYIRAYFDRWEEMLGGSIDGTVAILKDLVASGKYRIYALTNWSDETFPIALKQFDFLNLFEGIVVSGSEGIKKPDPAIYELILDRYKIDRKTAVFIDDSKRNIKAAKKVGLQTVHYQSPEQLRAALTELL